MARRAFYSFHYELDNWRVSQVRNMGVVDGNRQATDNDWETVKRGGDSAIQRWIDNQLFGKSVVIVLIGAKTAGRKWVNYEIKKGWQEGKGVLGIHIHNLKDQKGNTTSKGKNPFDGFKIQGGAMSEIVQTYDPFSWGIFGSTYDAIKQNMPGWIETAIKIRGQYA